MSKISYLVIISNSSYLVSNVSDLVIINSMSYLVSHVNYLIINNSSYLVSNVSYLVIIDNIIFFFININISCFIAVIFSIIQKIFDIQDMWTNMATLRLLSLVRDKRLLGMMAYTTLTVSYITFMISYITFMDSCYISSMDS